METRIIGDHSSIMESLLRDSFLSFPLINPISLLFSQPNSHSTSFCLSSLPLNAQSRIEEANFPDKPRSFRKSLLLLSLFFLRHSRPSKFSHSFFVTSFATRIKKKALSRPEYYFSFIFSFIRVPNICSLFLSSFLPLLVNFAPSVNCSKKPI